MLTYVGTSSGFMDLFIGLMLFRALELVRSLKGTVRPKMQIQSVFTHLDG